MYQKPEISSFVGPRPFMRRLEDQTRFFGREKETEEIVSLILSHKLALVYAMSGCGKTSILNAQVVPRLETYGCQVLPVSRIRLKVSTNPMHKPNIYLLNLLQSLVPQIDPQSLVNKSLSAFLKEYFANQTDETGNAVPQVLVVDQLEELFNFYPDAWPKQRENFFQEVADVLENNSFLLVLFIIREDSLAQLDPFIDILPERLTPRFRLERLNKEAASLAIKGPLKNMNILLRTS